MVAIDKTAFFSVPKSIGGRILLALVTTLLICSVAALANRLHTEGKKHAVEDYLLAIQPDFEKLKAKHPGLSELVMHTNTALPGSINLNGETTDPKFLSRVTSSTIRSSLR